MTRASNSAIRLIARFTVIEALRAKLIWLAGGLSLTILSLAAFIDALAIVESSQSAASIGAPLARLLAIGIVSVLVITSVGRELDENGLTLILAAPVSRWSWILGRFIGFSAVAALIALSCAIAIMPFTGIQALLLWSLSLFAELILICALSLMLIIALGRIPLAIIGLTAVYLCARIIGVIQQLNEAAAINIDALGAFITGLLGTLSLLLPRFDLVSQTVWLTQNDTPAALMIAPGIAQAGIYVTLTLVLAAMEMTRRDV